MNTSHNKSFWVAGILALALTTGIAYALETQSIDLPSNGSLFSVNALKLVDDGGATLYGVRPGEEGSDVVEFSVVFDESSESVSINGGPGVVYEPGQNYHVMATCRDTGSGWVVDIVVRNGVGAIIASTSGAAMNGRPTKANATAEDVIVLSAQ